MPNQYLMDWSVKTHRFKPFVPGSGACECRAGYWGHKWNPHTIRLWRTAIVIGVLYGIFLGIGIIQILRLVT